MLRNEDVPPGGRRQDHVGMVVSRALGQLEEEAGHSSQREQEPRHAADLLEAEGPSQIGNHESGAESPAGWGLAPRGSSAQM